MKDPGKSANQHPVEEEVLLFVTSPYGNLDAIVQHDGRVVYFYMGDHGRVNSEPGPSQGFGMQACWVRNLIQGPYVLNEDEMRAGIAPLLPRTHCKSPEPSPLPKSEDLNIVWFEEGLGAALLEKQPGGDYQTLAVIPPWSGLDGFRGYAHECAAESPLCWPLPSNPKLLQRIARAREFWSSFKTPSDPFADLQPKILKAYENHFANPAADALGVDQQLPGNRLPGAPPTQSKYWAIDGGRFPPRGLVHYRTANANIVATVAMSLCPQPTVEITSKSPSQDRRIELAIQLPLECGPDQIEEVAKRISSLADYPWRQFSWFGHGHSCDFRNVLPGGEQAVFVHDRIRNPRNRIELPVFRGDAINLLWLIPLDAAKQPLMQIEDFSVDQFLSPSTGEPSGG